MRHGSVSFSGEDQLQYGIMLKCSSSSIKLCHSTETALIKISDHPVTAADSAALAMLHLLDLEGSHHPRHVQPLPCHYRCASELSLPDKYTKFLPPPSMK